MSNLKIFFLAEWLKDRPKTWSGTSWGLYTALLRKTSVKDINLNKNFVERIWCYVWSLLDMGITKIKRQRSYARRMIGNTEEGKVLQFSEVLYDSSHLKTYIYQDLSVSYIEYIVKYIPEIFAVSAFGHLSIKAIERRALIQNEYYTGCSGIYTMGKWLANDLVERCGIPSSKVYHVGGGINLDKTLINYGEKQGNKLLFVGRDFRRKGGLLCYDAFCHLKKIRPDVEFYVAGPSTNPFPKNKVSGYYFMGDCDSRKLATLFNLCDVFVMPSYFEAYGLVFIEALTFGLPCIGRNAYEMPFFIENGETGYLLDKDDIGELANLMNKLLCDDRIKQNVRNKRDWYINEYSWDTVAERIIKVMES